MKRTAAGVLALTLVLGIPVSVMSPEGIARAAAAAQPSTNAAQETIAFLDQFFAREDVKQEASATVVSVVKDGQVLAERGYGVTNVDTAAAVDPLHTTFRVGSVSKVFTVVALMQLVDQGKISLDANIEDYLGGYKLNNPFDKPVTVEMLLTHSTGFEVRDPTAAVFLNDPSQKPGTLEDAIFANFPPVVREPGTSYMYDNFASGLVGYLVQKVSGESFETYMQKHVFEPLGMKASGFVEADRLTKNLPVVYDPSGKAVPDYRLAVEVIPEGSMMTTAADMSRFMNAFLSGGKTADGKTLVSAASMEAMSTYHLSIHPDVPDMAYGFEAPMLTDANGQRVIAKGGSIPGFESYMFLLPGEKTGVFVSTNASTNVTMALFREYMDRFHAGEPSFGKADFKPLTQTELKKFEGIYRDLRIPGLLTTIRANEDGTLTSGDNAGQRMTFKQTDELLFVDESGYPMAFKADENGSITYVKYANPGSYAAKLPAGKAFSDVPADHPYAQYIYGLQALGMYDPAATVPFGPEDQVTRGEFVQEMMRGFGIPASTREPAFHDIGDSPYAGAIQAAYELSLLSGTGQGAFEPDRPIKREEAAVFAMKLLQISGLPVKESKTALVPGTAPWAEQAVRMMIDTQLHGPEVKQSNGAYDYGSKQAMTKQELAALLYLLMLPEKSLL